MYFVFFTVISAIIVFAIIYLSTSQNNMLSITYLYFLPSCIKDK